MGLRKKVDLLEVRVKLLEDLCKELKSKHADDVVQIEMLRESMWDFENVLKKYIGDVNALKYANAVFNRSNRRKDKGEFWKP